MMIKSVIIIVVITTTATTTILVITVWCVCQMVLERLIGIAIDGGNEVTLNALKVLVCLLKRKGKVAALEEEIEGKAISVLWKGGSNIGKNHKKCLKWPYL